MSVILTQPDVTFGATERVAPEDKGPALLRADPTRGQGGAPPGAPQRGGFHVTSAEELASAADFGEGVGRGAPSAGMVAVGTEEARGFGGEDAVFALLHEARKAAATDMAEQESRNAAGSPYDGTLRFGLAPKLGAARPGAARKKGGPSFRRESSGRTQKLKLASARRDVPEGR